MADIGHLADSLLNAISAVHAALRATASALTNNARSCCHSKSVCYALVYWWAILHTGVHLSVRIFVTSSFRPG